MIWIYIPPAILVIALTFLVVFFGKKIAHVKKREAIFSSKKEYLKSDAAGGGKLKRIGNKLLKILERILFFSKLGIKKTEEVLAGWLSKLKARHSKGTLSEAAAIEDKPDASSLEIDIVRKLEEKEVENFDSKNIQQNHILGTEVIRTRIKSLPEIKMVETPALQPEDKVKEDALIHRIAENPRDVEAYRDLGDYYLSIGNTKDAKDSFKMVLKLRPRDLKAKSSLREIEMKMRLGN